MLFSLVPHTPSGSEMDFPAKGGLPHLFSSLISEFPPLALFRHRTAVFDQLLLRFLFFRRFERKRLPFFLNEPFFLPPNLISHFPFRKRSAFLECSIFLPEHRPWQKRVSLSARYLPPLLLNFSRFFFPGDISQASFFLFFLWLRKKKRPSLFFLDPFFFPSVPSDFSLFDDQDCFFGIGEISPPLPFPRRRGDMEWSFFLIKLFFCFFFFFEDSWFFSFLFFLLTAGDTASLVTRLFPPLAKYVCDSLDFSHFLFFPFFDFFGVSCACRPPWDNLLSDTESPFLRSLQVFYPNPFWPPPKPSKRLPSTPFLLFRREGFFYLSADMVSPLLLLLLFFCMVCCPLSRITFFTAADMLLRSVLSFFSPGEKWKAFSLHKWLSPSCFG